MFGIPTIHARWISTTPDTASFEFLEVLGHNGVDPKRKYHVLVWAPDTGYVGFTNV